MSSKLTIHGNLQNITYLVVERSLVQHVFVKSGDDVINKWADPIDHRREVII